FTWTVCPAGTLISFSTPLAGAGISASTLSVEISNSGSSRRTLSPGLRNHLVTVPSKMDSPIWGMTTSTAISHHPRSDKIVTSSIVPRNRLRRQFPVENFNKPALDAGCQPLQRPRHARFARQRGHPLVADAAGDDEIETREIVVHVKREAVAGDAPSDVDADGGEFPRGFGLGPHPGEAGDAARADAAVGGGMDQHFFQGAHEVHG